MAIQRFEEMKVWQMQEFSLSKFILSPKINTLIEIMV